MILLKIFTCTLYHELLYKIVIMLNQILESISEPNCLEYDGNQSFVNWGNTVYVASNKIMYWHNILINLLTN